MVSVTRPPRLRSGFHAEVRHDPSGLLHAGEQWTAAGFLVTPHTHPVWELYVQAHGLTRWQVGAVVVALRPGHLLAVAPGVRHQMLGASTASHHFFFAAVDVDRVLARHVDLAPLWSGAGPMLHRADAAALVEPFTGLVREVANRLELPDVGLTLAVDRLVLETTRCLAGAGDTSLLGGHPAVARVRGLLDRRYEQRWTIEALAAEVGLAPTYLAQLFAREVGVGPHRYLTERRIGRARQLLADSDLPVTAIAHALGFTSGQHLATAFRRATGDTPTDHRRRRRRGSDGAVAEPAPARRTRAARGVRAARAPGTDVLQPPGLR